MKFYEKLTQEITMNGESMEESKKKANISYARMMKITFYIFLFFFPSIQNIRYTLFVSSILNFYIHARRKKE